MHKLYDLVHIYSNIQYIYIHNDNTFTYGHCPVKKHLCLNLVILNFSGKLEDYVCKPIHCDTVSKGSIQYVVIWFKMHHNVVVNIHVY